jgi:hypothetical protein
MQTKPTPPVFKPFQRLARLRPGKFWSADKIVSFSAIFISLCTLIIFIYQTNLIQKQQSASVMPFVELYSSGVDTGEYKLVLTNNGTGPAFIRGLKIKYNGETYNADPAGFLRNVLPDHLQFTDLTSDLYIGQALPAGAHVELITVSNSKEGASRLRSLFGNQQARIEIIYASV